MKPPGETQLQIIWFALTTFAIALTVSIIVGAIWGVGLCLNLLSPVLWPLAIAAIVAYLFDPAVNWLERRGITRTWGITIVFVFVFCVISGVLASVIPQMVKESHKLVQNFPKYEIWVQQRFRDWADRASKAASAASSEKENTNAPDGTNAAPANSSSTATNFESSTAKGATASAPPSAGQIHNRIMAQATDWFEKLLSTIGSWILSQVAKATALIDVVIALILIPIYTYYFLRNKRWIRSNWTHYLPIRDSQAKEEVIFIIDSINQYMIAFFRGQVLVAICSGTLYTIGFLALGLDYAFLLGFLCMLLTMVPFLGPLVSFIISLALTALQFGDWFHPLMIFVVFAVVVSLENFFYSPRIMGNRVGLHPLVIIVAVMVGITLLGGLLGGILAIPFAAALRVILFRYLWKKPNGG
ncbi:MAG TPA: AI-2E family transporter [Verrucomicrobiae bacterium]|jgi:predicted PurR-regulated permease PerM|nr:AI-2E family transporter [Verrucomicrobiae bacterium]